MPSKKFRRRDKSLPGVLTLVSADGVLVTVGQEVERQFGEPSTSLVGRRLEELVAESSTEVLGYLRLCSRSRDAVPGSLTLQRRDGAPAPCRADGAVFRPRRGRRPALIALRLRPKAALPRWTAELERRHAERRASLRRAQLESELKQRDEQARRLSAEVRRKDQYQAVLAHELRNPLAALRSCLQILDEPGVPEAIAQQGRGIMRRQVQHLARLVDDLLDLALLKQGRLQVCLEPRDLGRLVGEVLESARPIFEERRQSLHFSAEPDVLVAADAVRLGQVLINLLSNAARFTADAGDIWVQVAADGDDAVLSVRDSGAGIGAAMLKEIFAPVDSMRPALAAEAGRALGIGLSIVRSLVELHGGTVTAASGGRGLGSEFTVRLPRRTVPAVPAAVEAAPAAATRSLRVLAVDDSRDAADALAMMLSMQGHQARVAYDGPSALELARQLKPHVVLLDLSMPLMDGYQLAAELRRQFADSAPVLVAVTGFGLEDLQLSRETGFSHHLVKPVSPHLLQQLLNELARKVDYSG